MDSKTYWEKREAEALKHYIAEEKEYQKCINRIYVDMLDGINAEILRFYAKYAITEGITIAEAKKRVSRLDIEEYERKAARHVRERNFSKQANTEMRLYNATMKINRLEMLKANIGLELIKGHAELEEFMGEILQGRAEEELKRQAGILGDTIRDNAKAAHSIVNASFHNATFSQRIWMHNDTMKADLSKLLQSGLIRGKNPRVLAKEMRKYVLGDAKGGAEYNAERLMRTELGRVQIDAQLKSFKGMDFEEYMFHANSGCCDACLSLDGKHFKISEALSGDNLPPMHPNCRCSVSAYADDEEYDAWIDFLSRGGTTEQWNEYGKAEWSKKSAKKQGRELTLGRRNGKIKDDIGTLLPAALVSAAASKPAARADQSKNEEPADNSVTDDLSSLTISENQFGRKLGKHASDFSIDPATEDGRVKFRSIILEIVKNANEIRIGPWRGQPEEVLFYIRGNDVVVAKLNGEFVSILKGGINNERVKNARIR